MIIGLTYDLRDDYRHLGLDEEKLAEFDQPETLDAIEAALHSGGYQTIRIGNVRALARALVAGQRWDLVFNIAEGLRGRSREAQVPALLEAYDIPYLFSDPLTLAVSLDKAMSKRLVRDAGIPTAPFAVLDTEADLNHCAVPWPNFLKPLYEGSGKGCLMDSCVGNQEERLAIFRHLRQRFEQPVLAETLLPGREFTVAIVGNNARIRLLAVAEIIFGKEADSGFYTFNNKEFSSSRVTYRRVEDAEARLAGENGLAIYRLLGCRDAGRVDFRADGKGIPQFLEINPLAGLHPTLSGMPIMAKQMGWGYSQLIHAMVEGALGRMSGRE
ncbi:MAG: D-alanine--D-alanine ligase [Magnetococcales bacterium]|nr:D-alanine--D-alanine ligase [Magnetococcales bacterium]